MFVCKSSTAEPTQSPVTGLLEIGTNLGEKCVTIRHTVAICGRERGAKCGLRVCSFRFCSAWHSAAAAQAAVYGRANTAALCTINIPLHDRALVHKRFYTFVTSQCYASSALFNSVLVSPFPRRVLQTLKTIFKFWFCVLPWKIVAFSSLRL